MAKKMHKYTNKKLSRGEPPNFSGQHFMHNKRLIREIVERANVTGADTVLELGAGRGALTTVLSRQAKKVVAVEYDTRLVAHLKRKIAQNCHINIIQANILNIRVPKTAFITVSNIPYAITTPIMKLLLNDPSNGLQRGIIVMEKGAAKRFTSRFIKDAYILAWRMYFDIEYVKDVSKHNFSPAPRVDSAIVRISRKRHPVIAYKYHALFWGLAQYGLKSPQVNVEDALRGMFSAPQIVHLKRNMGVQQAVRIGQLTELQWGIVFETMLRHVPRARWPRIKRKV